MPRRAFSLIELLVVLAIVAVIAALLFPVFAAAENRAKESVCISNLRSLGKAVHLYQADNDEHLPVTNPREGLIDTGAGRILPPDPLAPCGATQDTYHCMILRGRDSHRDPRLSDYILRFKWDFSELNGNRSFAYRLEPEASSVLGWDCNHLVDQNNILDPRTVWQVLRADGSVLRVKAGELRKSYFDGHSWRDYATPGSTYAFRFPGEAWPPRLTKLP